MRTNVARFAFVKSLKSLDFGCQPSLDKKQVHNLASCQFIEHGYRVLLTTAAAIIAALTRALNEGRLEESSRPTPYRGFSLSTRSAADRPGRRQPVLPAHQPAYERGPLILTSNQSFGSWGEVFGDRGIATAILDRVLHHAITINTRGNSYRLKESRKPA